MKDLPHIFDLFARASSEQQGGFGIGLAVARRLVEQHGAPSKLEATGSVRAANSSSCFPRSRIRVHPSGCLDKGRESTLLGPRPSPTVSWDTVERAQQYFSKETRLANVLSLKTFLSYMLIFNGAHRNLPSSPVFFDFVSSSRPFGGNASVRPDPPCGVLPLPLGTAPTQ